MTTNAERPSSGAWAQAGRLAARTPESRNRYVDFLRAVSISAVIVGHWLIAAPWMEAGQIRLDHMLDRAPWTQALTWIFQVMPIFFMVGGYSNAASWSAAKRRGDGYGSWLSGRFQRIVLPMWPLLIFWSLLVLIARRFDLSPAMVRIGSQAALVAIWFLAVYVLVILFAPLTYRAWQRWGMGSFWALVIGAVVVDLLSFGLGTRALGWLNYLCVWLGVHQIGYVWRDQDLAGARAVPWAVAGLGSAVALVIFGPYPWSMVGVPGAEVSNSLPPTLAMMTLGIGQCGLLLSIQAPLRRWLGCRVPWTATVLVNGTIMTVYLWHLTAMVLIIGLANLLGGVGLHLVPGSLIWWATRPIWMVVLFVTLLGFMALFGRYERPSKTVPSFPAWRNLAGAAMLCAGLAQLALDGMGNDTAWGLRAGVMLLTFGGMVLLTGPPWGARGTA